MTYPLYLDTSTIAYGHHCDQAFIFRSSIESIEIRHFTEKHPHLYFPLPNPELVPIDKKSEDIKPDAKAKPAISMADYKDMLQADNKTRGLMAKRAWSKEYPREVRIFKNEEFTIKAAPDGVGIDLIYEFASTKHPLSTWERHSDSVKTCETARANLEAYLFGKNRVRVDVYRMCPDYVRPIKYEGVADYEKAKILLTCAFSLLKNEREPEPPTDADWKCRCCDFYKQCKLTPLKHNV
jgi:hypothetical protein